MASWKEKGEVPDSDDEDEDDSQGLPNEGYGQGLSQEHRNVQRKHTGSKYGDEDARTEKCPAQLSRDASEVAAQVPQPPQSTLKQSSLSPRVFKQPPALLNLNQLPESQELSSQVPLHPDDEISHSYVRLSSSLSSLNRRLRTSRNPTIQHPQMIFSSNSNKETGKVGKN
jgi:hypothetical protein